MLGKKIVWLCLCAFRFVHRRFASRRVSAAGWGKPGIHQFKPKKTSLSPEPSFIVVIVIITRMAVAVIITIILLFIMSSLPPSSA